MKQALIRHLSVAVMALGLAASAFAQSAMPKVVGILINTESKQVLGKLMKTRSEAELKAEIETALRN